MTATERAEFRRRQAALARSLSEEGIGGALVVSRGGATFDRFGDVLYLANHYQTYGYLPETPGLFSGRSHCALVINAEGKTTLCLSVAEHDADMVVADEVRSTENFSETVAGALRDAGLGAGPVGLIGSDVLPLLYAREIGRRLPDVAWRDCDELLQALRRVKSPTEQDCIRKAAAIHSAALGRIRSRLAPGVTEAELMSGFIEAISAKGAALYFAAISSGPRIERWCTNGLPGYSTRPIMEGEMLRFDTGIILEGYLSDFGRTLVCGSATKDQAKLIDTVQRAVDRTIEAVRPGRLVCDMVREGEAALAEFGVRPEPGATGSIHSSFPVLWGHGLGLGWEPPMLTENDRTPIVPGMYLAIERTLTMTGTGTAAAEQTLLVHENEVETVSASGADGWS